MRTFSRFYRLLHFVQHTTSLEIAWLSLWLGTLSFKQRTAAESLMGSFDATHLQRAVFLGIACLILLFHLQRFPKLGWNPITLYFIYSVFCMISSLWSVARFPTLGKAMEIFVASFIVMKIVSMKDAFVRLKRLIDWFVLLHACMVLIAFIGSFLLPSVFRYGVHRVVAPYFSANAASYTSALLATFFLGRYLQRNSQVGSSQFWGVCYVLFMVIAVYAHGRTAIVSMVIGSIILFILFKPTKSLFLILPFLIAIEYYLHESIYVYMLRGQSLFDIKGLSGRTHLFTMALQEFSAHPILGHGFSVGSRSVFYYFGTKGYGETISSVHNGVLEVLLGGGFVGFILWVIPILWGLGLCFQNLLRRKHPDIAILAIFFVSTTMVSTGLGGWMGAGLGLFLVITAYLSLSQSPKYKILRVYKVVNSVS